MKKHFTLLLVILVSSLFAQGVDWNITGAGSRAMGMGGAFIGVADDATAITWNPAGLYNLERMEASIVTQYYSEDQNFDTPVGDFGKGNDTFVLNFTSLAYPLLLGDTKITAAIAMQRQLELFDYNDYGNGDWDETIGAASTVNIGAGTRFMDIFAAGFCANIWMGSYEWNNVENGIEEDSEGDFSGFNMGVGGMVDLNFLSNPIPLKLGVSIKTPFDLMLDDSEGETTIEMPLMLGLGLSYRLGELLTIAVDFETKGYKDKEISYIDDSDPSYDYTSLISTDDLTQGRIGLEYLIVSDFAVIPLRVGFQNVPTTSFTPVGDQVLGNGYSFGTGLIFEKFAIDLFSYYAECEADFGFADFTIERLRAGISGIVYF